MDTRYRLIQTRMGCVGVVGGERGLQRIYLPKTRPDIQRRAILRDVPGAREDNALLPKLAGDLRRYFAGQCVKFDVRFDWGRTSAFLRRVWRACCRVGDGQTVSYGQLASRVGRPGAARAVGMAMRRNPCPIVVPCHRVLRSDGSLGGYSGPGGVKFKRRLLEMEAGRGSQATSGLG